MFQRARLKLTFLYSLIFLFLFWSLSAGVYLWMNKYFGDTGIDRYIHTNSERFFNGRKEERNEPPSDIILDELRDTLVIIYALLFFIVPTLAWFLTGRTLSPVQQSYEREKRFLADASHDLRTPLSILSGELEFALQKDTTKEEYNNIIASNKEEVTNLIALVENMLFLSREEVQYKSSQKEQVDLTDILTERIAIFQKAAKQKKIQLEFIFPKQSVVIKGNAQLLKRLFTNLLDNALQYTTAKGKISVTLAQKNTVIVTKISDTGIGISQENQEKVFERFFRIDTARSQKGYGLGLAIAKQIVEFHHGSIHLASRVGKGTTITLSFPLITQNPGKNQS